MFEHAEVGSVFRKTVARIIPVALEPIEAARIEEDEAKGFARQRLGVPEKL